MNTSDDVYGHARDMFTFARMKAGDFSAKALSEREAEVLRWMSAGKTNREIGLLLGISSGTVRKHVEHIFRKLGVTNRTAAAMRILAG